jgi:hypothetical protein
MAFKPLTFKPLAGGVVALLALAACQQAPPPEPSASVTPMPESTASSPSANSAPAALPPGATIQWKEPNGTPPPSASANPAPAPPPPAGSVAGLPPGSTIQWKDEPKSAPAPAASASQATPTPTQAPMSARPGPDVRWRSGIEGDVVTVDIIDRFGYYRVDRVALVSPDGQEIPAQDLTRYAARYDSSVGASNVGIGLGSWGGSSSGVGVGFGLGFPLGGSSSSASSDPDRNAPHTVARVALSDPDRYRRTARDWTVRVRLIDSAGAASVAQFPAPLPAHS